MEEITPETPQQRNKDKFFMGTIAVLTLALIFQTGYLIKTRNKPAPPEPPKQVHLYSNRAPVHSTFMDPAWNTDQWDPFMEMERMQESMNRMFRDSFQRAHSLAGPESFGMPQSFFEPDLDIQDLKDKYIITLDIPGMEKDKLNIEVRDQILTVSGERSSASERRDNEKGFYSMERRVGAFQRSIPLPEDAVSTDVKASYEKGELRIEIPRKPAPAAGASSARKITVQ